MQKNTKIQPVMDCESEGSEASDFSDEDLGLLKRALHVEIPDNFDPNKIPENGEEYLQQVIYEAKKCPAFTAAPANFKNIKPPSELQLMENCQKAPKSMLPSMAWQDEAVEDFTKLRKFLVIKLETHPKKKTSAEVLTNVLLELPKLTVLAGFTQEDKINLLETILSQMNQINKDSTLSNDRMAWVYSLLATLETPLCPDTCHVIREIARKCSQIRAKLPESVVEEQRHVPLNLIICLIARFFRQLDLADE